jgi:hypothetical protein
MYRTIAMLGLATALVALPALGEDPKPAVEAEKKPDYSKPAIMYILYEVVAEEPQVKAPDPYLVAVPGLGTVGFVLATAAGSQGADTQPMPTIDAFSLLSSPAAYTPYTFRDRWREWREKRAFGEAKK